MSEMNYPVQQGWQCPCCKRVYSPTTQMCFYCPGYSVTTTWDKGSKTTAVGAGVVKFSHPSYCECTGCRREVDQ